MNQPLIGLTLGGLGLDSPETEQSVLEGFLRLRQETPLNAVEFWMAPEHRPRPGVYWPEDYSPPRRELMAGFLRHFEWCGVHLPFLFNNYIAPNPAVARPARRQLELGIEIAGGLGARYCVVHAEWDNRGFLTPEQNLQRYVEVFGTLCDLAAKSGMLFCVETCFFAQTPDVIEQLIAGVARENYGVTLDAGKAMLNNGGNAGLHRLIERVGERIRGTHLYDYPAEGDYRRILPGGGVVDIPGVVARLRRLDYAGSYHLETGGDYDQQKAAILALHALVKQAQL